MAKGLSLHIGLNRVDPSAYGGWAGQLVACEADAKDMEALAKKVGYETKTLLTGNATYKNVSNAISDAAAKLGSGDIFLLTYSGHGGQIPDAGEEEEDGQDETWVLHDRQILDDELYSFFGKFKSGVRIFMLSDSCHSGTVAKAMFARAFDTGDCDSDMRSKAAPPEATYANYKANRGLFEGLRKSLKYFKNANIKSQVILISGCEDWQTSLDGSRNGLFTENLLRVWNDGGFAGNYKQFHSQIRRDMPADQQPNLLRIPATGSFDLQHPFAISSMHRESEQCGSGKDPRLEMIIYADPGQLAAMDRDQCAEMLQNLGADTLGLAIEAAKEQAAKNRSGNADVGCSIHDGHWECHGGVHINF